MTTIPPDDPLRRKPPTIDLSATEVPKAGDGKAPADKPNPGSAPGTTKGTVGGKPDAKPAPAAAKPAPAKPEPGAAAAKPAADADATEAAAQTAIEPMAATGLDGAKAAAPPGPTPGPARTSVPPSVMKAPDPVAAASAKPEPAGPTTSARPEPAKPEPTKAAPPKAEPVQPVRSGAGAGSLLAASVIGGLVGAGLLYAAERYALPQPENLAPRVAALEGRPATPAPPETLLRRLDALEASLQDLTGSVAQARSAAEAAAKQAGELASRPVSAAASSSGTPAPDPALQEAVAGLEARLATAEGAATGALDAAKAAGEAAKAGAAALPEQIDALRTRFDGRVGAIEAGVKTANDGAAALRADLQVAQTGLGEIRTGQQSQAGKLAAAEGGIEALRGRLDETGRRVEDQGKQVQAAAAELAKLSPAALQAGLRLVVADRLGASIRAGAPLGPTTASLARLGADPAALEFLKPFATTPPTSVATLAREFAPLAERMTTEPRPAATTIGDRLLRMADKIVAVRDLGDGSGTDLPGLVARIEASLGRGDAPGALAAWAALPETAKSISAAWAEKLKGRVAAEEAARKIGQDALAALDASAPAAPATR